MFDVKTDLDLKPNLGISLSDIVRVEYIKEMPSFEIGKSDEGMHYKLGERHTLEITCKKSVPADTPDKILDAMYDFTRKFINITSEDKYQAIGYKNIIIIQPSINSFSSNNDSSSDIHVSTLLKGFSEQVLGYTIESKIR